MKERLQKILSSAGVCSRRAAETYITAGRVTVNGVTASLGESADWERDQIAVDGRMLMRPAEHVYLMLNKPRGYITTLSDERGRAIVTDLLSGVDRRVFPVGRLDRNTEGLLLLTDDGELAQRLTHPSHEVYKQYLLTIRAPDGGFLDAPEQQLARPIELDGRPVIPARCRLLSQDGDRAHLSVSIREGRNRHIRRLCEACGYTVVSLKRVAVGDVKLGNLSVGKYRTLTQSEIRYLKSL